MANDSIIIPELKAALESQTDRVVRQDARDDIENREVTIMGDKEIPYRLLKRVMATCTRSDYGRLSLAIIQKTSDAQLAAFAPAGN